MGIIIHCPDNQYIARESAELHAQAAFHLIENIFTSDDASEDE